MARLLREAHGALTAAARAARPAYALRQRVAATTPWRPVSVASHSAAAAGSSPPCAWAEAPQRTTRRGARAFHASTAARGSGYSVPFATTDPEDTVTGLAPDDIAAFNKHGFLVFPGFWSKERCKALRTRADEMVRGFDASTVSVFSTKEQTRTSDDYFLESGDKVRFFFEEDAFDDAGALVREKETCINKIGHALHDRDDLFHDATYTPRLAAICHSLGYETPLLTQTMYIFKQPGIGGVVGPHQDGTFLYTQPQSVTGFWWALEDCTTENGCLWAVPGSHNLGVARRFKRSPDGVGTVFEPKAADDFDVTDGVPLEVEAGTMVLLHSALVHYSHANKSERSRHAYTLHVVEGGKGVVYPEDNWLQRPESDPFHTFADAATAP